MDDSEPLRIDIELSKRDPSANAPTSTTNNTNAANNSNITNNRNDDVTCRRNKKGKLSSLFSRNRSGGVGNWDKQSNSKERNASLRKSTLYRARRSLRVKDAKDLSILRGGDGDTWIEAFAVSSADVSEPRSDGVVNITPKMRSYFYSQKTGKKEWDEPPSGASKIEFASEQTRALAEAQGLTLANEMMSGQSQEHNESEEINGISCDILGGDKDLQLALEISRKEASTYNFDQTIAKSFQSSKEDQALKIALKMSKNVSNDQGRTSNDKKEAEALSMAMALSLSEVDKVDHSNSYSYYRSPYSIVSDDEICEEKCSEVRSDFDDSYLWKEVKSPQPSAPLIPKESGVEVLSPSKSKSRKSKLCSSSSYKYPSEEDDKKMPAVIGNP